MAITKIDFPTASTPSYTPVITTDYNNQNEYIERNSRGYNAVSLTNWDSTTTIPQVAAGSVIEINGSTWDITTNTDIDSSGATAGTVYVYFDDSAPEFKFLDTAPAWSSTLNGWYLSGDRFTGYFMTWDGASSFSNKHQYVLNSNDGGALFSGPGGNDNVGSTLGIGASELIPRGLYYLSVNVGISITDFYIEIQESGSWRNGGWIGGLVYSDGVNYRVRNVSGASRAYNGKKIW